MSYKNFGPRLGFAYQITPKLWSVRLWNLLCRSLPPMTITETERPFQPCAVSGGASRMW